MEDRPEWCETPDGRRIAKSPASICIRSAALYHLRGATMLHNSSIIAAQSVALR